MAMEGDCHQAAERVKWLNSSLTFRVSEAGVPIIALNQHAAEPRGLRRDTVKSGKDAA